MAHGARLQSEGPDMIEKRLRSLWEQLQGKKPHMAHLLTEVRLDGLRGLDDLRIVFDYPVSVIAGANATGKSTVLFAAACAYKVPSAGVKDFVPSTLFPDYRPKAGGREDARREVVLEFEYATPEGRSSMRWRRAKSWNRSYMGRRGGAQPERQVYLRTLSNLSNPSEVRGVLSMSRLSTRPDETPLTASQIEFAQQMLPFRYSEVVDLSSGSRSLLFAAQQGGAEYSELHMAAGERSILRLSQEVAQLDGALVLIDEVEAGLHPWLQQLLMLQLQQLALRNDLQVIVTSHSPVVLDSVPPHARIFLERNDAGRVVVRRPYRDMVQDALYGRSHETLNVLCEDEAAEGVLHGVLDDLLPREGIARETVRIGRDTGASEFPAHAAAFRKFGQVHHFVFVIDGDERATGLAERIKARAGTDVPVLFLPGRAGPEAWVWGQLDRLGGAAAVSDGAAVGGAAAHGDGAVGGAAALGLDAREIDRQRHRLDALYDTASDSASNIAKSKLRGLAEALRLDASDICRRVARLEAARPDSGIRPLVEGLTDALRAWRAASP